MTKLTFDLVHSRICNSGRVPCKNCTWDTHACPFPLRPGRHGGSRLPPSVSLPSCPQVFFLRLLCSAGTSKPPPPGRPGSPCPLVLRGNRPFFLISVFSRFSLFSSISLEICLRSSPVFSDTSAFLVRPWVDFISLAVFI